MMKLMPHKSWMNVAAALFLTIFMSSCTKVITDSRTETGQYIEFSTTVGTKAPVESADQISEFAVWASFMPAGNDIQEVPMNGITVYRDRYGMWTYDELKKWQAGEWHFSAFYPLPSSFTSGVSDDVINIAFNSQNVQAGLDGLAINYYYCPAASHDIMTAMDDRIYSMAAPDSSPVHLSFSHLLSRISIAVRSDTGEISLKSLRFEGMGILGDYNTTAENKDKWRLQSEIPGLPGVVSTGKFEAATSTLPDPLPAGESIPAIQDLMLIPQTVNSPSGSSEVLIYVEYVIGNGNISRESVISVPSIEWKSGRHYNYTVKVNTADVSLNLNVVDWDERNFSVEF